MEDASRSVPDIARRLATLQLADWHGLPPDLRPPEGDGAPMSLLLGDEGVPAEMVRLDDPSPGAGARAWLREGRVVMVDVTVKPSRKLVGAGIAEPPDARLGVTYGLEPLPSGEWVFARRGLALIVRSPEEAVLHAIAFTPAPIGDYTRSLRPAFEIQRRPPRQPLPLDV